MSAFFDNIDEFGLYSHFTRAMPSPSMLLYPAGREARHNELRAQIQQKETALAKLTQLAQPNFRSWLAIGNRSIPKPQPAADFSFEELIADSTPDSCSTNRALLVDGPEQVEGKLGKALKFNGDNSLVCR